jgi:hypothetical protein
MKKETIRIFYVDENGEMSTHYIKNDLESKQALVKGLIEEIQIDGVSCIINEEGRLLDLERSFAYEIMPNYWDCVHGTAFFVGADYKTGEFTSISDEDMNKAYDIVLKGRMVLGIIKEREQERENAN